GMLGDSMDANKLLNFAAYAVVFIIAFWIIPWAILKALTRRVDFVAQIWLKKVWYLGLFALCGYIASFIKLPNKKEKKEKKAKHPCPHCGYALDSPLAFEKLDFEHCANCGGDVEHRYTIDDYIGLLGNALSTDAEKVTLGIVTMESFV